MTSSTFPLAKAPSSAPFPAAATELLSRFQGNTAARRGGGFKSMARWITCALDPLPGVAFDGNASVALLRHRSVVSSVNTHSDDKFGGFGGGLCASSSLALATESTAALLAGCCVQSLLGIVPPSLSSATNKISGKIGRISCW